MFDDVPLLRTLIIDHFLDTGAPDTSAGAVWARRVGLHGLTSYAYRLATEEGWDIPVREALSAASQANARHALGLAHALGSLATAADGAGVRLLSVKGVVLSAALHGGDVARRQSSDIDVVIHPTDLGTVATLLRDMGYEADAPWRDWTADTFRARATRYHEYGFRHASGTLVEVHTRLTTTFIPFVPAFDELWLRRQQVRVGGHWLSTLSWTDTAIHLATHGYRHAWARLVWLCDIAHLMARQDMPWPDIEARARGQREWVATEGAVWLAHRVLGAPLPADFVPGRRARRAATAVERRLQEGRVNPDGRSMLGDQWRSRDDVREQLRYLWRVATTTTPADAPEETRRLPIGVQLRRPVRLVRRYLAAPGHGRRSRS
jgi:hypothetical protein